MATLQRSKVSFRREGSSGVVWDEKCFSEDLCQVLHDHEQGSKLEYRELRPCQSTVGIGSMSRIETSVGPNTCPRSLSSMTMNSLPHEGRFLKKVSGLLPSMKSRK